MKEKYQWRSGEHLRVQQSSKKYTSGSFRRRYDVYFKIDENGKPVWSGGVKPTQDTIDRVNRYVETGSAEKQ